MIRTSFGMLGAAAFVAACGGAPSTPAPTAEGWLDATHFVGARADGSLSVFDLSGIAGAGLGTGSFVGALQPA